jgi:hypothetical protein
MDTWIVLSRSGGFVYAKSAGSLSSTGPAKRLPDASLRWRHARQDHLNSCSPAGFAVEMESAAQTIRDDGVDDMKAEAGATPVTAGREERIEGLAFDVEAHTATVVRKKNFNILVSGRPDLDVDEAFFAVGKSVCDRVEEEVGQHLSVWTGITVHRQIGLAIDGEGEILLSQSRPQAGDDLFGQLTEIEDPLV